MWHLIKKDFFIHKNIFIILLIALIIYMLGKFSPLWVGIIYVLAITMQIFSVDEKRTAQMFLSSLPVTRKEIVSSKYIGAVLYIIIIITLLIVGNLIINQSSPNWTHVGLLAIVSLVMVAIMYPISYKFSSKYLAITFIVGLGLYFFIMSFFIPNMNDQVRAIVTKLTALMEVREMLIALMIVILIYGVSWILSIKIYEKKAI